MLGAQAWATRAQGDKAEALKFMRAAADLEDGSEKHVAMENRLYPMRELLADMLLADGDAAHGAEGVRGVDEERAQPPARLVRRRQGGDRGGRRHQGRPVQPCTRAAHAKG